MLKQKSIILEQPDGLTILEYCLKLVSLEEVTFEIDLINSWIGMYFMLFVLFFCLFVCLFFACLFVFFCRAFIFYVI